MTHSIAALCTTRALHVCITPSVGLAAHASWITWTRQTYEFCCTKPRVSQHLEHPENDIPLTDRFAVLSNKKKLDL
jgi:hypothetical protein